MDHGAEPLPEARRIIVIHMLSLDRHATAAAQDIHPALLQALAEQSSHEAIDRFRSSRSRNTRGQIVDVAQDVSTLHVAASNRLCVGHVVISRLAERFDLFRVQHASNGTETVAAEVSLGPSLIEQLIVLYHQVTYNATT